MRLLEFLSLVIALFLATSFDDDHQAVVETRGKRAPIAKPQINPQGGYLADNVGIQFRTTEMNNN
jgi:hypothetical protein